MDPLKTPWTRRRFIQNLSAAGAALALSGPASAWATGEKPRLKVRGYAAFDPSGKLRPWEFERRPVGDHDVLIEIRYASICHSDIHQLRGDWGPQRYPQVPGHEIAGVVTAVGKAVTRFKVGDRAGVGCMVDSCMTCERCTHGEEHHCERGETQWTYGYPSAAEPTRITQGGYSTHIVVRDHFAIHIPEHIALQDAAPLLCAGITTYSPLMRAQLDIGARVGVAGIGGLGHMAVKLAVARGAEVYAFTTSPSKVKDLLGFGVKEAVVVDDVAKLRPYRGKLDYMLSTIPAPFDVAAYAATLRPHGRFTQVGMPPAQELKISAIGLAAAQVEFNASLIGGIPETQEVVHYCADNGIKPQIELIRANQINEAWEKVLHKQARYRYVIDAATF